MTFIISNKEQQEKIKQLALPVLNNVEKLLCVFKANGDKRIYKNVQQAVIELNKTMFLYYDNVPSWELDNIRNSLNKIINSMPNKYRDDIKYEEFQKHLELLAYPVVKTGFFDKIKQAFNNVKLRMF